MDLSMTAVLFEHETTGVPKCANHVDCNGNISFGFYILYLEMKKYEAIPEIFYQLLEKDIEIGWTDPAHVEYLVFAFKGIQIIEDHKVSSEISENTMCLDF